MVCVSVSTASPIWEMVADSNAGLIPSGGDTDFSAGLDFFTGFLVIVILVGGFGAERH